MPFLICQCMKHQYCVRRVSVNSDKDNDMEMLRKVFLFYLSLWNSPSLGDNGVLHATRLFSIFSIREKILIDKFITKSIPISIEKKYEMINYLV
jgi:hypothetical protein